MCKNYTKLDQFKRIKSQEIVSQEIEKCYKIDRKKIAYVQVKQNIVTRRGTLITPSNI